jgi:hypothetical protein
MFYFLYDLYYAKYIYRDSQFSASVARVAGWRTLQFNERTIGVKGSKKFIGYVDLMRKNLRM